ncbi:hypothetical protein [Streptomyces sp. NPDC006463]|uniref:hypothetical protein n=1 Tax=Streptomyces sp. NPDC006463 TaxID=3364746 RepID=UPI0036C9EC9E
MSGPAARPAALLWALFVALDILGATAATAWARPVGSADGPGDVALAIGLTAVAAVGTGLWLRSHHRRSDHPDGPGTRRVEGGDP